MSDSIKKWEELHDEEKARQRVVAQNGPSGLHYGNPDEDIELAPAKEREEFVIKADGILSMIGTTSPTNKIHVRKDIEPAPGKELFTTNNVDSTNTNVTYGYFDNLDINLPHIVCDTKDRCPSHHVEEEEEVSSKPDFKKITDSIADLLLYKNIKYGNAALEPMDIFQGKCKVGQRLDDKIARVKNGGELQKNDIADLIGYLTLVCVEKGWDNFEEFKD